MIVLVSAINDIAAADWINFGGHVLLLMFGATVIKWLVNALNKNTFEAAKQSEQFQKTLLEVNEKLVVVSTQLLVSKAQDTRVIAENSKVLNLVYGRSKAKS